MIVIFTSLFWIANPNMPSEHLTLWEECLIWNKKSLKIKKRGNQNPYIEEEQTTQWSKEKSTKGQTAIYKRRV